MTGNRAKSFALHLTILLVLFALQFLLPPYHHTNFARILVLASYAIGYNILLGYTGLLSLGHAMFFATGLYCAGLSMHYLGAGPVTALATGILGGAVMSLLVGAIALRTTGVAFMIVTLMFAQAFALTTLYFNEFTGGDEGFVLAEAARQITLGDNAISLTAPEVRYNGALLLFAACLVWSLALIRSPIGHVLVAIRENEARTKMLGYNGYLYKLLAMTVSGSMSAAAGAIYALLFAYVGSTFAGIQYSILALLWVLLGGIGTTLGPLIGTIFMFYLVDVSSGYTSSYMIVVGLALILLVLWFPKGIVGTIRQRWAGWLP